MHRSFSCKYPEVRISSNSNSAQQNMFGFLVILCVGLWLYPHSVFATMVKKFSLEELITKSNRIIMGRCISSESRWNGKNTVIYTYSRFAVSDSLKGRSDGFATVVTAGGTVDGITQTISGMPQFELDEEAILFLEPHKNEGWLPVGLSQGRFRIVRNSPNGETEVIHTLSGLQLYDLSTGTVSTQSKPSRVPLNSLLQRIRSLVTK